MRRHELWKQLKQESVERGFKVRMSYRSATKQSITKALEDARQLKAVYTVDISNLRIHNYAFDNVDAQITQDIIYLNQEGYNNLYDKLLTKGFVTWSTYESVDDHYMRGMVIQTGQGQTVSRDRIYDNISVTKEIVTNDVFNQIELFDFIPPEIYELSTGNQILGNKCGLNALYTHLTNGRRFKKLTLNDLQDALGDNPNINEIHGYLKDKDVTHYIKDILNNTCVRYQSDDRNTEALYAVVSNNHIYTSTRESFGMSRTIRPKYEEYKIVRFEEGYPQLIELIKSKGDEMATIIVRDNTGYDHEMLNDCITHFMDEDNYLCSNIIVGKANFVTQFTKNKVHVVYEALSHCQDIIEAYTKLRPYNTIEYKNQSMGTLASLILDSYINNRTSVFTTENWNIVKSSSPNVQNRVVNRHIDGARTADLNRCYAHSLITREEPVYFLSVVDYWVEFDGELRNGIYLVSNPNGINVFNVFQWKGRNELLYMNLTHLKLCLHYQWISVNDIKYYLMPSYSIAPKFKEAFELINKMDIGDTQKKLVFNSWIGMMGSNESQSCTTVLEKSREMCISLLASEKITSAFKLGSGYVLSNKSSTPKLENNMLIMYDAINHGNIQLALMYKALKTDKSVVISYMTDSISMTHINEDAEYSTEIGGFKMEKYKRRDICDRIEYLNRIKHRPDILEWNDKSRYLPDGQIDIACLMNLINSKQSFRIQGCGGTGKSTTVASIMKDVAIGTATSHRARIVMKNLKYKNAQVLAGLFSNNDKLSFAQQVEYAYHQFKNYDYLVVDEITMVTDGMMRCLYHLHQDYDIPMIFIGDYKQLSPPNGTNRDNCQAHILKRMCDCNLIVFKYMYRCDEQLHEVIDSVYNQTPLKRPFPYINEIRKTNISFTNRTCDRVNAECLKHFHDAKDIITINKMRCAIGCKIMCTTNKQKECSNRLYNGDMYVLNAVTDTHVILEDIEGNTNIINKKIFNNQSFILGYCITAHKAQGSTITEKFNVFDVTHFMFTNEMAYTSFSRAKSFDQISVDKWPESLTFKSSIVKTVDMTRGDKQFIVYGLIYKEQIFYVGRTYANNKNAEKGLSPIQHRFKQHMDCIDNGTSEVYKYMRTIDRDGISIVELAACDKDRIQDLEADLVKEYSLKYNLYNENLMKVVYEKDIVKGINKEAVVVLKGSISYIAKKNIWRYRVMHNGKNIDKERAVGKKRTSDQAKQAIIDIQKYYSLHGTFQ